MAKEPLSPSQPAMLPIDEVMTSLLDFFRQLLNPPLGHYIRMRSNQRELYSVELVFSVLSERLYYHRPLSTVRPWQMKECKRKRMTPATICLHHS